MKRYLQLTSISDENTCVNSYQLPLFFPLPEAMIHHNPSPPTLYIIHKKESKRVPEPYGVSSSYRVLSPQLLLKRYDRVRNCLQYTLGFTTAQREVILRLLRLWAYYGKVYPKEALITELPGCSKVTFWRTIKALRESNLIVVINRYVIRPHAQISNLYRLDKLLIILARYLAEHGVAFLEKWLKPFLAMPGRQFWELAFQTPVLKSPPVCIPPPNGEWAF